MKDARKRDEDKVTRTWRNFRVTGVEASQRNLSCVTMRKTDREQVVVVSSCTASIFAAAHFTVKQASRHSHLSFSTDVPRFANYCGLISLDLFIWLWYHYCSVWMMSLFFPIRFHQAVMLHRLCLNVSGCFYMLTCYCWLGFAMKAFWIIETTPFPQQPQPHTYPLRWRIFLCTRRKNIPIYVLCRLHLF